MIIKQTSVGEHSFQDEFCRLHSEEKFLNNGLSNMIIKQAVVYELGFRDEFYHRGRTENFSDDGLKALYEHLMEFSRECGNDYLLDVIALCCEYTEYDSIGTYNEAFSTEYTTWDDVMNNTTASVVVPFGIGAIVSEH